MDRAEVIAVLTVEVLVLGSLPPAAPSCLVCLVVIAGVGREGDMRIPLDKKAAALPDPPLTVPLDLAPDKGSASLTVWGADAPLDSRVASPLKWGAGFPLELGLVRVCLGDSWVPLEGDDDGASSVPCTAPDRPTLAARATDFAESADANELIPAAPDL